MLDNKRALDLELVRLSTLVERIQGLAALSPDEQALLEDLVTSHAEATQTSWLAGRIQAVVDVLYPSYDRRGRSEEEKPVRWPERDWWWNGARVEAWQQLPNGDFTADVTSYVGCGETDAIQGLVLPTEWLYADDVSSTVLAACKKERERRATNKRDDAVAAAQREANAAVARLARLQGDHHG